MSEKNFMNYFMKTVEHGYRTSLIAGGGFPDCLLIHGERHSLVELKLLEIGPSGDRKLKGLFKQSQPPWYMNYLAKGGYRLFVVFKTIPWGKPNCYGLLHVSREFVRDIDTVKYSDLERYYYKESPRLTDLLLVLELS